MSKLITKSKLQLPGIELLAPLPSGEAVHGDTAATAKLLVDTLAQFNLHVEVVEIITGPVLTCYRLFPAAGTKVERIAQLVNTLQMAIKATSLRIQAPAPGKQVVGVEVPNPLGRIVTLREILLENTWPTGTSKLPLVLGKDIAGRNIVFDLAEAPHMLVAGGTGSGKSVCINSVLVGLLMARDPAELRLILIDPKRMEFTAYKDLPHLLMPVVTDIRQTAMALRWAIEEMDRRYTMLQSAKVRNIVGYNSREVNPQEVPSPRAATDGEKVTLPDKLPYIVVVIDEVADLMITGGKDIELAITRLAQLSAAVGIHIILSTQRPYTNVITESIKANFPCRIAFQVVQKAESRTIIDQQGAESLLGRGDMLFMSPRNGNLVRIQGALVTDDEIRRITDFIRSQGGPLFDTGLTTRLKTVEDYSTTVTEPWHEDIDIGDNELVRVTCAHGSRPGKGAVRIQIRDGGGRLRQGPEIPFTVVGDVVRAMIRLVQLPVKTT